MFFYVTTAVFLHFVIATQSQCPNSTWHRIGKTCYFIKDELAMYPDNVELCKKLKATMVSIHSETENFRLATILHPNIGHWIGLKQKAPNSKDFYWEDGTSYDYEGWVLGHPDAIWMKFWGAIIYKGEWFNKVIFEKHRQLCQFKIP